MSENHHALRVKGIDFTVYPAIDLRGGSCVRLKQGDFGREKQYDADPVGRARQWERGGAHAIHVVDLDGAREGRPVQLDLVRRMAAAVSVPLQVGGGVRTLEDLLSVRDAGAARVVVGTSAVDARGGIVATHGWREASGLEVLALARELAGDGVSSVLYTDVARDGMDAGAALEGTAAVADAIPTIASGGVRGPDDVAALVGIPGITGAVVGTALYEGRTNLEELLEAAASQR